LARRNLKSCLEADFLRKLQARVLLEILLPTRDALIEKGFPFPPDGSTKVDHKVLAGILRAVAAMLSAIGAVTIRVRGTKIKERAGGCFP
jgi:hypothetical protein